MTSYTFFKFPDLDARIGLARDDSGERLAVALLRQGGSQIKKAGKVVGHKYHNKDRRAASRRLFEHPAFAAMCEPVAIRNGKAANPPQAIEGLQELELAYRGGKNFRFDFWCSVSPHMTVDHFAEELGLVPVKNRPLAVLWA